MCVCLIINMTEYQKKLVELKRQGLPVSEIAKLVNRSVRTVSRNLKLLGLTQNGRTDILNQDVQNMRLQGILIHRMKRYQSVWPVWALCVIVLTVSGVISSVFVAI